MTRLASIFLVFAILSIAAAAIEPTLVERAEHGDSAAQCKLGAIYLNGDGVQKDSVEAAKWYLKAAEQGVANAQGVLGAMYHKGDGVPMDPVASVKWYRKAAEQGDAYAQAGLGAAYALGAGIPKNGAEAVKWYRLAAEQGVADAQGALGWMYANGEGVPKDYVEGLAWTNIAAANGSAIFVENRDKLERLVGIETTLVAQQRSRQILQRIEIAKGLAKKPANIDLQSERKNEAKVNAELSAASEASKPQPKARPKLSNAMPSNLTSRIEADHNVGILGMDARWSEFGEYLQILLGVVQAQWDRTMQGNRVSVPHGSHVTITFKLNSKGEIGIVAVEDAGAGKLGVVSCRDAIQGAQPYRQWTDQMKAVLGDEQTVTLGFYIK